MKKTVLLVLVVAFMLAFVVGPCFAQVTSDKSVSKTECKDKASASTEKKAMNLKEFMDFIISFFGGSRQTSTASVKAVPVKSEAKTEVKATEKIVTVKQTPAPEPQPQKPRELVRLGTAPLFGKADNSEQARDYFIKARKLVEMRLVSDFPKGELGTALAAEIYDTDFLRFADFYERPVQKGEELIWMLYRDGAFLTNIPWGGNAPMETFAVDVPFRGNTYTFAIPKICSNISLLRVRSYAEPKTTAEIVEPKKPMIFNEPKPVSRPQVDITEKPHVKFTFGYGFSGELGFRADGYCHSQQWSLIDYFPVNTFIPECEDSTAAFVYVHHGDAVNLKAGDLIPLKRSRLVSANPISGRFSLGVELRVWKDLWLGVGYENLGKLRISGVEKFTDMRFADFQYLGYYPNQSVDVYYVKLERWETLHNVDYELSSQEFSLSARWEFSSGSLSLIPIVGVGVQVLSEKVSDILHIDILWPWVDQLDSSSDWHDSNQVTESRIFFMAGLNVEAQIVKHLRIGGEVVYRAIPGRTIGSRSLMGETNSLTDWSITTAPWRITANIKVVI